MVTKTLTNNQYGLCTYYLGLQNDADRETLVDQWENVSKGYLNLSKSRDVRSFAVDLWREVSDHFENRVSTIREGQDFPEYKRWEKRLLHLNLKMHLKEGTYWADRATVERTSKGDRKQCEVAYRNSLRHLVFVAELSPEKDSEFENVLSSFPVVFRGWTTVCFQEP